MILETFGRWRIHHMKLLLDVGVIFSVCDALIRFQNLAGVSVGLPLLWDRCTTTSCMYDQS